MYAEVGWRERWTLGLLMFVLMAARPKTVRRHEWTLRPWRRFLGRTLFSTLLAFGLNLAAVYAKPKIEAVERFERAHARRATRAELEELLGVSPVGWTRPGRRGAPEA